MTVIFKDPRKIRPLRPNERKLVDFVFGNYQVLSYWIQENRDEIYMEWLFLWPKQVDWMRRLSGDYRGIYKFRLSWRQIKVVLDIYQKWRREFLLAYDNA